MTEFSDAMLVLLIFFGYVVHNGGLMGAWDDLCARAKRSVQSTGVGDRFIAWLDKLEKKEF